MDPSPCKNCTNMNHPGMSCEEMDKYMKEKSLKTKPRDAAMDPERQQHEALRDTLQRIEESAAFWKAETIAMNTVARQMAEALHKARKELVGESLVAVLTALEFYRKVMEGRR